MMVAGTSELTKVSEHFEKCCDCFVIKTMVVVVVTQLMIGFIHKGNNVSKLCLWEYSSPCSIFLCLFYFVNFLSIWCQKCFFLLPVIFLKGVGVSNSFEAGIFYTLQDI